MNDLIQRIESDLTNGDTSIVIGPPSEHLAELQKRYSMKYKGSLFGEVVWEVISKRTGWDAAVKQYKGLDK